MTAYGADVTRYGRSLFVWCQVWATADNTTVPVGAPKRFLTRSKAATWGAGRVIELEHQEARRAVYDQMAAITETPSHYTASLPASSASESAVDGGRSPRPSFLP